MDSKNFYLKIKDFKKKLDSEILEDTKEVIRYFIDELAAFSPVYTGQSLSSWGLTINDLSDPFIVKINKKDAISKEVATANAKANIEAGLPKIKVGDIVVIFNRHEYISIVEFGGPKNEPRAMVRQAIAKAKSMMLKKLRK